MSSTPPGVVFDCTIFLQALANRNGPAFACKQLVDNGRVVLFLSDAVLQEVREVLGRPELRQKLKTLTPERVLAFLADVTARAVMLADVPNQFSYPRDPKDEPYVNLALAAGARYLVAWDKDLLDLMNEDLAEGKDFRQRFPALRILTPVTFLREFPPEETNEPASGETSN